MLKVYASSYTHTSVYDLFLNSFEVDLFGREHTSLCLDSYVTGQV